MLNELLNETSQIRAWHGYSLLKYPVCLQEVEKIIFKKYIYKTVKYSF